MITLEVNVCLVVQPNSNSNNRRRRHAAFSIDDHTAEERRLFAAPITSIIECQQATNNVLSVPHIQVFKPAQKFCDNRGLLWSNFPFCQLIICGARILLFPKFTVSNYSLKNMTTVQYKCTAANR